MTVTKTSVLVLDYAEPEALGKFYASLLGAEIQVVSDPGFVELVGHNGVHLAIRRYHGYAPPNWPRPDDAQQAHFRIPVAHGDLDEAEREAVSLGEMPVDAKASGGLRGVSFYADPTRHSFSFVVPPRNEPTGRGEEAP
ncbi:VOC family protein [Streptomyces sp. NBC_01591]|uniref:VOC family protein n=1 Tax=Streptomyces sp. NBC_01591 TaxID=2975888 RepID=UPI002DDC8DA3|nr:VOC family protein [Streptomyces sp. NBC_01591]WSD72094.1 VOC family protein [Streptomyces sp. NBC_01591]